MMKKPAIVVAAVATTLGLACSDGDGQGTVSFTTYGEDFIEKEIGPGGTDEAPVVDGWTITYDKFLIALGEVSIGEEGKAPANTMAKAKIFNMKTPGQKSVVSFANVPGK